MSNASAETTLGAQFNFPALINTDLKENC